MSERIQHSLIQGTDAWHQFRLDHDGASEAAAMLGLSKKVSRSELMRAKHTGIAKEFSDWEQENLLDRGHEVEALARPMAETILGEQLYPVTYSFGRLSASTDGLTMDGIIQWECKLWNAELAAAVERGELPDEHQPQCQQGMMVDGADQVLFMVTDGTPEKCVYMFVRPDPAWQARIVAGWTQFREDLASYQPVEVIPAAVAAPIMQLPALSVQVRGEIEVIDNLKVFGERLNAFIDGLDKNPSDDQAFADAEAAIKTLSTAENALEAAKASALAQVATVDEMTRTVALYAGQARQTRLMLEKLVKARKESIRVEIVQGGKTAFAEHVARLNKRLGKQYMPIIPADFAGVIKGRKTIASLRDAVDNELARVKIEANEIADRIAINVDFYRNLDTDYGFLFPDFVSLALKANDDFAALIKMRIADHVAAEAKRLEAERERIRAEEQAKLEAERQRQEHLAEQARIETERVRQEAIREQATAAGQASTQPPKVASPELERRPSPAAAPSRPSNVQIIEAVAFAFGVSEETAYGWILEAFVPGQRAA